MSQRNLKYIRSEKIEREFEKHLQDEFNERILFSGLFGSGKSSFLKYFFDNSENYIVLKLYPVNYTVAANQDIFELVKYELLYELLNRFPDEIDIQTEQFSRLLLSQMFLLHQMKIDVPLKILSKAIALIPKAGDITEKVINGVLDINKDFKDYKNDVDKSEYDTLNKYIKNIQEQKGHIYEFDEITQLIVSLLGRVKEKKQEKFPQLKTVLLIDDLDRVDPEHVFRLFNVFSAHYDDVTESNKFGFDKIIFVCDLKNIREMFNHRYGLNVEFTGYIDKFYSTEIFNFEFKRVLRDSLTNIINESIYKPYKNLDKDQISQKTVGSYLLQDRNAFYILFTRVIQDMIDQNIIRIRTLKKFTAFSLPDNVIRTKYGDIKAVFYPFIVFIINIEKLFTHELDLEVALEKLYRNYKSNYEMLNSTNNDQVDDAARNIIHYSLFSLINDEDFFKHDIFTDQVYFEKLKNERNEDIFLSYNIIHSAEDDFSWPRYIKCTTQDPTIDQGLIADTVVRPNPYWFLYCAYKNFKQKNYF